MIDNTTDSSTPEERAAARQAAITAAKEERRAQLGPAEASRLTVVEDVSAQLERAGIPFLLFADSTAPDDMLERCCWWQFNRMGYEVVPAEMMQNARHRIGALVKTTLAHTSLAVGGAVVWVDTEGKPIGFANEGEWTWAKRPDEP